MIINRKRIEECATSIINEPDIYNALKDILGSEIGEDKIHDFTVMIVESIITEIIVKKRDEYEKNYTKTFANGIKDFLKVFDGNFKSQEMLLKQLRVCCKNYKFIPKNKTNDYSIFFFTFKIFDFYCENCDNKETISDVASQLAKNAYIYLKRPYKKTPVIITSNTLLKFINELPIIERKEHVYTLILISFIQAVYNSDEINEIDRVFFYDRFYDHIILLNLVLKSELYNAIKAFNVKLCDPKKIKKSISNRKNYLKKQGEEEKVKEFERITKFFNKLPLSSREASKKTRNELQNIYIEFYNFIVEEFSHKNEIFMKLLHNYIEMPYDDNGEKYSLLTSAFQGAYADLPFKLKALKGCQLAREDNIYLQLIIPDIPAIEGYCLYTEDTTSYQNLCDALTNYIAICIDEMFLIDESDTILNDYHDAIKKIKLKDIGIPILSFDVSNNVIDHRIRYISNIIS